MLGFVDEAIAALPEKLREPVVAHFLEVKRTTPSPLRWESHRAASPAASNGGIEQIRKTLSRRGVDISASILTAVLLRKRGRSGAG